MSTPAIVLVLLAAGTYALKAVGPLVLGGRALPHWLDRTAALLPTALLAALVAVSSVTDDDRYSVDARLLGLLAAAVALRLRAPFVVVVVAAAATTALARLIG